MEVTLTERKNVFWEFFFLAQIICFSLSMNFSGGGNQNEMWISGRNR
jgi:hypothetical protein